MRKNNIMLIAALVASPMALADDHDYGYGYYNHDGDITIEDSGNVDVLKNKEFTLEKDIYISNVGNKDKDVLELKGVGNVYKNITEINQDVDNSLEKDLDVEINTYLADSKLYGHIMDAEVTYGGACCKGKSNSSDVTVMQTNNMNRAFGDASGISIAGQNVGNNSMVQQTTATNAALVGTGGGIVSPGGDY
ncbi:hypothetical protein BIT28_15340 [Photobacterium proteolyticum]|uniref:Uncharacterized protein n=1 Tax=Photobacterium proteolyticum TaxID=1903952 RepID=A0A1Q9G8W1_9GAMM|nr:hypothetical protein [Photobacterium proteolyticum]OLQ70788.1 hypothetical protein BIT28_15340 [Photobacterium proteolyticum]